MKIQIKKTEMVEVELTLPHCRKDVCYWHMFVEGSMITVLKSQNSSIEVRDNSNGGYNEWILKGKECSSEEFMAAYEAAKLEIDEKVKAV